MLAIIHGDSFAVVEAVQYTSPKTEGNRGESPIGQVIQCESQEKRNILLNPFLELVLFHVGPICAGVFMYV